MNPTPPQEERSSFWRTVPGVLTATGTFIAAIGTLIGALAAAGVFQTAGDSTPSSSASSTTTSPAASSSQTPSPVVDSSSAPPGRASIVLVYNGDTQGCSLQLDFLIGGQSVQPTGNRYTVPNVETGPQQYSVAGTISCPTLGFCTADGSGVINVVPAHSYAVSWLNSAVGSCDVTLNG
jgi:hypothetical protein